ncbi:MAG: DEAD/DEAH box helicase [bacterium]
MYRKYSKGRSYNRFSKEKPYNRFSNRNKRSNSRQPVGSHINPARFINKAIAPKQLERFVPVNEFRGFAIDESLKSNIFAKGYKAPTSIQDKIIPQVLRGNDVVGIANTGTGKTAAFLIPLIQKVIGSNKEKVLIITPTRELALQINQEFKDFTRKLGIWSACCVGGASIRGQIFDLRSKNNFVIGTPGRLKDLIEKRFIKLSEFSTIVLDEADRMLDMGFIGDTRFLVSLMPKKHQTLFFSATIGREVESLIKEFLYNPVIVSVKTADTPETIEQDVVRVAGLEKIEVLRSLLVKEEFHKILIFGKTKHGVKNLSIKLIKQGFAVESIHGDKIHSQRQRALEAFRTDKVKILVATDVAARGLDIPNISHVINYDLPATYDDYVHRIGRTGRGNKAGKALTFID